MYTAGIDIGGTNTRIALIDEAYEIIQRIQFPTDVNNPQATLQKIQETVQSFSVAITGVGLSCPGPLDLKQGIILDTPNLKGGWHGLAVSKELSARLKVPVFWKMMQISHVLRKLFWVRGKTTPMCSF